MNNKQLEKLIRLNEPGRTAIGDGLYVRIPKSGKPSWQIRYTIFGKRKWYTLTHFYPRISIAQAKATALEIKASAKDGKDPAAERLRENQESIRTVNDLFDDWFETDVKKRLKHFEIPKRVYEKEIAPSIGKIAVDKVTPRDIRAVLHRVTTSGRPTIANDALMFAKQLFRHAIKLNLIHYSPAQAFTMSDAGGSEKSRTRSLSFDELQVVFKVLRDNPTEFTRENYLACALLVSLGVRKGELIAARWEEFDFDQKLWFLPEGRSKTGVAITIPLPETTMRWLSELKIRAAHSEYVFPSRRTSKRRGYISDDTLNHAIAKMFGQKVRPGEPPANKLGDAGIEHFTIHDLRRTCRSLLAHLGTPTHVAERCLNHKLKGVEAVYNHYDYLSERTDALDTLALHIAPLVDDIAENVVAISFSR